MIWPRRQDPEPLRPEPAAAGVSAAPARGEADLVLAGICLGEYRSLVRLAVLLLHDVHAAEDVVLEAFVAVHAGRRRPRDTGKALSDLRREVVSRSRSVARRRAMVGRTASACIPDGPGAEPGAVTLPEPCALQAALRCLPDRQREAIVLRYYVGLPVAETAASMRVSKGAVRRYAARGMAALMPVLAQNVT